MVVVLGFTIAKESKPSYGNSNNEHRKTLEASVQSST
jgi:hypothetical protein